MLLKRGLKDKMKIVISPRRLFSIEDEQVLEFARRKDITLYPDNKKWYTEFWLTPEEDRPEYPREYVVPNSDEDDSVRDDDPRLISYCEYKDKYLFDQESIDRSDPVFVDMVEELRDSMLPENSDLQVIEIPDGVKWCIFKQEDGSESISERSRSWHYDVEEHKTKEYGL
jgi:hypothetical protein